MSTVLLVLAALHVKAALFTAVVLGVLYAIPRTSACNRYLILRFTLLVLALLPMLMVLLPPYFVSIDAWPQTTRAFAGPLVHSVETAAESTLILGALSSIAASALLGYVTVCALLLAQLVIGLFRTQSQIDSYPRLDHTQSTALLDSLRQQLRLNTQVDLAIDITGAGPYVWGIRRPAIVVPEGFASLSLEIQRTVLTHELIHIAQRDPATSLAARVLRCFLWANPAFWWLDARLKLEMERSCDDRAVSLGINAAEYAGHLLSAIEQFNLQHRQPSYAVAMARAASIKSRIDSLLNDSAKRGPMSGSKSTGMFCCLLLLAMTIGACAAKSPPQVDQLIAGIERIDAANESVQIRTARRTPDAIEIDGHSINTRGLAALMRSLDDTIGRPRLMSVVKEDAGNEFKMRVENLNSPPEAQK